MVTLLRVFSLLFAVLFVLLTLGSITLIGDEGYLVLIWLFLFLILAILCIFAFRSLGKRQEKLGITPRPGRKGTVLLVLFNVIAICFIGALLIPGLIQPPAHQRRTMSDIYSIGTAVEAYAIDHDSYPQAASIDELAHFLQPTYIKQMPLTDGWNHAFRYQTWKEKAESKGPDSYAIASPGENGEWEIFNLRRCSKNQTEDKSSDILWRSGEFIQWPKGL
jgi:Type II secretion system (T2SS), protein G